MVLQREHQMNLNGNGNTSREDKKDVAVEVVPVTLPAEEPMNVLPGQDDASDMSMRGDVTMSGAVACYTGQMFIFLVHVHTYDSFT
ncbi:uncharacterized protein ARMOST_19981 [Armillaria ostoyae]|uniref:Uncharacterized protein n=1 Tax=Armillaria ostoyae TaxID=47428 RepID=A0A284S627_ARMOS|nr:uncharacterized protein ARMOST_19981 [Armillaria ostoyae]